MKLLSWHRFDSLLRGRLDAAERVRLPLTWFAWQVLCAATFGASLGVFALTTRETPDLRFMLASAVKVPLLLLFTSGITIPSLYVFGALRGLRFSAREFAAHLMVAHTVLAAVLGSLAPVLAFFALTTSSYSFMVLLDVFACAVAGTLGVRMFVRALNEPPPLGEADAPAISGPLPVALPVPQGALLPELAGAAAVPAVPVPASPLARPQHVDPGAWKLLGWWLFLYVFVGGQAAWILRPFLGRPELEFVLLRGKEGGFVAGVLYHLGQVLLGR